MKKTGLVLSGGGARGFAHLGIIKALNELQINISAVSGTSAGALFGSMFAAGYAPEEILEFSKNARLFNFPNMLFGKSGVFTMQAFEDVITTQIPTNTFEALQKKLTVAATDIKNNKTVYFSSGNLSKAVTASACIPLVFEPVKIDNSYYLDGGILNNFPVEPLLDTCDVIIGVHVNAISHKLEHLHMKDMLDRSFHCALSQSVYSKSRQCALFLDPPEMSQFGMFDFHRADEIFNYAYNYALSNKNEIEAVKFL